VFVRLQSPRPTRECRQERVAFASQIDRQAPVAILSSEPRESIAARTQRFGWNPTYLAAIILGVAKVYLETSLVSACVMNPTTTNGGPGESVVDEVRAIRETIDAEAGHDIRKLAQQARRVSEEVRREYGMKVAEIPECKIPS
jgi:hypothetical protein